MNKTIFFLRTALHNLHRGGQRVVVAVLCVAFGVMSLSAMIMVAQSFEWVTVLRPSEQIGADISLNRRGEEYLLPEHIAQLQELAQAGEIDQFTLLGLNNSLVFREEASGEVHFDAFGLGVEPEKYPLAGSLVLSQPGNVGLPTLLKEVGDLVITRDLAEEFNLKVGDRLLLSDFSAGIPVEGLVQGIASDTPNHQGSKIYYTLDTAARLVGRPQAVNTALANASDPGGVSAHLDEEGWWTFPAALAATGNQDAQALIEMLLKGAGILGMLVGGIGIANTMQVLLRRRQREVAIWKTLGYREADLMNLFSIEAALLGIVGSLLGMGAGWAVSRGLVELFSRSTNLLISWRFSPYALGASGLVGLLTTVIFALWSIMARSSVSPMALLRNEPLEARRAAWVKAAGLGLLLALPFAAITSIVMSSTLKGIGVLLFAAVGLVVLGGLLGGSMWVVTRILPLRGLPLAHMAKNSLRRRGAGLVFAMIALFTGVVSIGMGVVVTENAQAEMVEHTVVVDGYNLKVSAPAEQAQAVREKIESQTVESISAGWQLELKEMHSGSEGPLYGMQPVLVGRSEPGEYQIVGADWGSHPDGAYAYTHAGLPAGSQVEVTMWDGSLRTFDVVGSYDLDGSLGKLRPPAGLLVPLEAGAGLPEPDAILYFVRVLPGRINQVSAALGAALPDSTIINLVAYLTRYTQIYHNLFVLALSMAGLALLAGVLLVGNSVSLAMLDRRYEIGVLKAVGYSRLHILASLAVEYGLVGLIASLAGVAAVQVFVMVIALINHLAATLLVLSVQAALVIVLTGVGLTLVTVVGVTWGPTRVSPVVVLNDRA